MREPDLPNRSRLDLAREPAHALGPERILREPELFGAHSAQHLAHRSAVQTIRAETELTKARMSSVELPRDRLHPGRERVVRQAKPLQRRHPRRAQKRRRRLTTREAVRELQPL